MTAAITLDHVTKRFGAHTALNNFSVEVPRGVVFALLGENGAGKTTAIKLALGLDVANAGELEVLGLDSRTQGDEVRRRVGYVPERPALYEWMTAAEIGWFTGGFYPSGFEQHYLNLLQQFAVPTDRKIGQMSKGMRAKVALSLALAHEPELLILDEPTSGLDTLVRREFLESMVDIAAAGRTVLLSSHLISEVERVADIVAIMHEGRLLVVESLDTLKCQTKELTITLAAGSPQPPKIAGQILCTRRRQRQWQVLARNLEDNDIDALRDTESVVAVEVRTPGLEEIFVAYMQGGREELPANAVAHDERVAL